MGSKVATPPPPIEVYNVSLIGGFKVYILCVSLSGFIIFLSKNHVSLIEMHISILHAKCIVK